MKKNIETITVTKDIIHYEALDGTLFDSEEECMKYEKTAICAINGAFSQIPQTDVNGDEFSNEIGSFSYDDTIHAVYIKDVNALVVINKWLTSVKVDRLFSADDIGTIQLFDTYDDSDVWLMGTPEEYKKRMCDFIDNNLVNPLMKKINDAKEEK